MDDSGITCDDIIDVEAKSYDEESKTVSTNFNEKKATCKTQSFYILLAFLLISIVLVTVVSICSYLMKYRAKQKHLLPFRITNNELKQVFFLVNIN